MVQYFSMPKKVVMPGNKTFFFANKIDFPVKFCLHSYCIKMQGKLMQFIFFFVNHYNKNRILNNHTQE